MRTAQQTKRPYVKLDEKAATWENLRSVFVDPADDAKKSNSTAGTCIIDPDAEWKARWDLVVISPTKEVTL